MNDPYIPVNAYIFIGVASLVLAFVTIMDKGEESKEIETVEEPTSFTDYLPTLSQTNEETKQETPSDMFNTNLNSDKGLAQNEYQWTEQQQPQMPTEPQPEQQPTEAPPAQQQPNMFSDNINSETGMYNNEQQILNPPTAQPVPPPQQNKNPFTGGKNKTGKKMNKKNKKTKRNRSN